MVALCDGRERALRRQWSDEPAAAARGARLASDGLFGGAPLLAVARRALEVLDGLVRANGRDIRAAIEEPERLSAAVVPGDLAQVLLLCACPAGGATFTMGRSV